MKKAFIVVSAFLVCANVLAYSPNREPIFDWDYGEVRLNSGELFKGKIFYDNNNELILVKDAGRIIAYTPFMIDKFHLYDKEFEITRTFVALRADQVKRLRRPAFFEVALEGEITLLRKQRRTAVASGYFDPESSLFIGYSSQYIYYSLHNGKLSKIKNYKKDVLELMKDRQKKVASYIEHENIKLNRIGGQIKLIMYYNRLKSSSTARADSGDN